MADYKVTWIFEGMQANPGRTASSVVGWSETWYLTEASIDAACRTAINQGDGSWLKKRTAILHSLYAVKWVRVSDVTNPHLSKTVAVAPAAPGQLGAPPEAQGGRLALVMGFDSTAAQINCAVELDISKLPGPPGDIVHHRRALIRGLPRSIINGNILKEVGEGFAALQQFATFVGRAPAPNAAGNGVAPIYKLRFEPHPVTDKTITALTVGPANPRQIVVTADLGVLALNDKVLIRAAKGMQGLNRIWTVAAPAAGPPYTLGRSRFDLSGTYLANSGLARKISYQYGAADEYVIVGLKMKKVGSGGFGRTRGRRRAS